MGIKGNRLLQHLAMLGIWGLGAMNVVVAAPPMIHRLDLRPPSSVIETSAGKESAFPSMRRQAPNPQEENRFAAFNTDAQTRIPGRLEEMARRVHREGVPVARLWENKSALVSFGLNQRGKPGLWIIQKTH
jgi:hypothetical protein